MALIDRLASGFLVQAHSVYHFKKTLCSAWSKLVTSDLFPHGSVTNKSSLYLASDRVIIMVEC